MEMTKEWITQFNKKCAEFIGWKYDSKTSIHFTKGTWIDNKNIGHCAERGLSFHSDWNLIMEVVNTVKEKTKFKSIDECSEEEWYVTTGITRLTITTPKKAVIQSINQFLIWYNENNS